MHQDYEEQKGWRERLERERRNLSVSVEASLADRRAQTHIDREEAYEQAGASPTTGNTTLVPPRLSLQSRVMSTVRPGSFVASATSVHHSAQPIQPQPQRGRSESPNRQDLREIAELAQSFAADLARYGYDPTQASTNPLPAVPRSAPVSTSGTRPLPREDHPPLSSYNTVPAPFPNMAPSQLPPSHSAVRQRLAGRSTRIRLEVPSDEQMAARSIQNKREERAFTQERGFTQETPAVTTTSTQLPALDLFRKGHTGTTSARLPVIDIVKGQLEASRRGLNGNGFFEAGQCDLIVTNKHVTGNCVIQVMLTGNPGPVVVHYISLQPRIGFTIHLTAPTNARTPFNYVILPGSSETPT